MRLPWGSRPPASALALAVLYWAVVDIGGIYLFSDLIFQK